MLCPRCGRQLLDSATFCPECGAPIELPKDDGDAWSPLSDFDTRLSSVGDETQFMSPSSEFNINDFDDSGVIEELGSLDELRSYHEFVPEIEPKPEPEPVAAQPRDEEPLVVDVPPLSYDTELMQPVYQPPVISYAGQGALDDDQAYDAQEPLYVIHDPIVPTTYADVAPITGGVPTEHYLSRKRRRKRKMVSFIILLIFLAAAAGVAWYTWDQEMWGGKRVPALIGMTEDAARSALTVKGLKAEVQAVPADAGFGIVLDSDPGEGKRCATDKPVVLQVASERLIPEVVGMTADDARAALIDEGATNIVLTYANSSATEGTIIEVNPPAGSKFLSSDPVTITIAQPYTVPAVVGMSLTEAQAAVTAAGLRYNIEYVNSWNTRDTIISVSPEAGTRVEANATVTMTAPIPYPSEVYELGYYYRITPIQISDYLNYLNYTLEQGATYSTGEGYERWKGATGDIISFTNEPESSTGPYGTTDVFASDTKWTAVRYQCAKGSAAAKLEVSEKNALAIVQACGLGGTQTDSCTNKTIVTPYSINREAYDFVCIQGEWGEYVWVILMSRGNSVTNTIRTPTTSTSQSVDEHGIVTETTTTTEVTTTTTTPADTESTVIVAFMPKETTNVSGLASYGDSFCDYFAYANLYSSNR